MSDSAISTTQPLSRSPLPWWAKFLVAVVITGFVACSVSLGVAVNFGASLQKYARTPAYINKVVKSIAVMPEKLPEGFRYELAAAIFDKRLVILVHDPDKSVFLLGSTGGDPRITNAKDFLKQSMNGIPGFADSFKIEKDGQETVAGQTMYYVTGSVPDDVVGSASNDVTESFRAEDLEMRSGMVGCILNGQENRLVLMYGWSPAKSFNLEAARSLLASIKGFAKPN